MNESADLRGRTRRAWLATCGVALTAGCSASEILDGGREPAAATACDESGGWRQHQGGPENGGRTEFGAPSFEVGPETLLDGLDGLAGGPGVSADGQQHVFTGDGRELLAYNAEDGTELWRRSFRSTIIGTPLLVCDAVIVQTVTGTVALDIEDGETVWEQRPNNAMGPPTADDNTVFVSGGLVTAVASASGERRWDHDPTEEVDLRGCCLAGETLVAAGKDGDSGMLVGLDPTNGDLAWRTPVDAPVEASPTYREGTVYVPDEGNQVHAVDAASGAVEWQSKPYESYPGDRLGSAPVVVESTVVVPSGNGGETVGVDAATGERQWSIDTGPVLAPPLATDDGVLVGTMNEGIFLLSPDGEVRARATDTRVGAPMAATDAGLFYKTAGPGARTEINFYVSS